MTYLPINKRSYLLAILSLAFCANLLGATGSSASYAVDCLWEFNDQIAEAEIEATNNYYYCRQEPYAIAWMCHHENGTRFERAVDDAIKEYEDCVRRGGGN